MATGNGYYNSSSGRYQAKTAVNWDTYLGDSAGNGWDDWLAWDSHRIDIGFPVVPELPLTFTTDVIDYGSKQLLNPLVNVSASHPAQIVIESSDSLDSAGALVSPSSVTVDPLTSSVNAINARYFQFTVKVDNAEDSAGFSVDDIFYLMPYISNIEVTLSQETVTRSLTDIQSSSLSGSIGVRQLDALTGIGTISSIVCQPHLPSDLYVTDTYVEGDSAGAEYVEAVGTTTPVIYVDKSTTPPTLNIFDVDSFGHRQPVDVTFDAIATGMRQIESDGNGSIVEVE